MSRPATPTRLAWSRLPSVGLRPGHSERKSLEISGPSSPRSRQWPPNLESIGSSVRQGNPMALFSASRPPTWGAGAPRAWRPSPRPPSGPPPSGPVARGRVPSSPGDGRLRASPIPRCPSASATWAGAAPPRSMFEARASRREWKPDPGMLLSGSAFRSDRCAAPASSGAGGASRRGSADSSRDSGRSATTWRRAALATSAGMGRPASYPVFARASLTVAPSQLMPPPGRATTSDARTPIRSPSRGIALSRKDTPPPSARTRSSSCCSLGAGVTTAVSLGAAVFGRARNR